ncbi:MAG: hypothetical protein ACTID3_08680 [Halomonas sp.]|uniref:hypothetical protein n=1 Tax=Halomonas sp. TaxID=1486246 RepID=UPI003F8EB19D
MAEIDFPAGLKTPLQADYGLQHVDANVRTRMASGRTRSRQQFTYTPTRVNVQWLFPAGQAQLFEAWYWAPYNREAPNKGGIQGGTLPFNTKLRTPIGLRIYKDVSFTDVYSGPVLVGGRFWRVTATLEIAKRPVLPPADLEYPEEILYSSLFDITMNKHWPKP